MKKIAIYILIFFPFLVFSQDNSDLTVILERFNNLPTTTEDIGTVIQENFNNTEREILIEYLSSRTLESLIPSISQNRDPLDFFYGVNSRAAGNREFGTLNITPPFDTFNLILETFTRLGGDDITPNGTLYTMNRDTFELVTLDRLDGSITTIGPLTNIISGYNPTGLSYNFTNDITYVTTTNSSNSILYTIDLSTGTLTEVGDLGIEVAMWLVIDNDGNAWTADLATDTIYSVNLETAATTGLSNSLGIDINFAQDATYDHINDIFYMAAYLGSGVGGIYIVDTDTGLIELVGSTEPLAYSFSCFSADDQISLSVNENTFENVSIYPNPTKDKIFIKNFSETIITDYVIYDLSGKAILVPTENNTIDISQLSNGIYFLKITILGRSITKRIIKI